MRKQSLNSSGPAAESRMEWSAYFNSSMVKGWLYGASILLERVFSFTGLVCLICRN